jgi:hypothetical protein
MAKKIANLANSVGQHRPDELAKLHPSRELRHPWEMRAGLFENRWSKWHPLWRGGRQQDALCGALSLTLIWGCRSIHAVNGALTTKAFGNDVVVGVGDGDHGENTGLQFH